MILSSRHVRELTGVSERRLGYWLKIGLVKASVGSTGRRGFSIPDVVAIKTVAELRDQGCPLQRIRKAISYLRNHYPTKVDADVLSSWTMLTDGRTVFMVSDSSKIMEVMSRQTVFVGVCIGRLILETQRQLDNLPFEWTETVRIRRRSYRLCLTHDVEDGGFVAQCVELPGAIEQGETVEEARANGKAAIRSVLTFMSKRAARRRSPARARRRA